MTKFRSAFTLVVTMLCYACTSPGTHWTINKLVSNNQYTLAKKKLKHLKAREKQDWEPVIAERKQQYIQSQLKQARQHWASKNYYVALQTIEQTIERAGKAPTLAHEQNIYRKDIRTKAQRLNHLSAINEAEWLASTIAINQQYQQIDPEYHSKREHEDLLDKQQILQQRMYTLGKRLHHDRQVALANRALQAAAALGHLEAESLLKRLRTEQGRRARTRAAKAKQRKQAKAEQQQQAHMKGLMQELDVLMKDRQFVAAIALSKRLALEFPNAHEPDRLSQELNKRINRHVRQLFNQGRNYYTVGAFSDALDIWDQILVLQPDNGEAQSLKKRTIRVISNLERLSQSPFARGDAD